MRQKLIIMLIALLTTATAWADDDGECGKTASDYVTWSYNSTTNTLTIAGTGAMADYANANAQPWKDYRTAITSVVIGSGVTHIGNNVFNGFHNTGFTSVTIPASVTSIGNDAFGGCWYLASVTFAANSQLTSIGKSAFSSCEKLNNVTIPASVTSIGENAFMLCKDLTSLAVAAGNTVFDSRDNCNAIIRTADNTLVVGCKNSVIPNTVTAIGNNAFYSCTNLTSVTIPASVTSIDGFAFRGCTNLSQVTFAAGSQLETIGSYAFSGCTNLFQVTFAAGSQLETIGSYAFYLCTNLSQVTIPASVTSIDGFAFRGCTNLATVTVYAPNCPIRINAFADCNSLSHIYVFKDKVKHYQINSGYSGFIEPIPDLTVKAADDADASKGKWCSYYNGLADVTVPAGTTVYTAKFNADKSRVNLTETGSQIIKKGEAVLLKADANIELSSAADGGSGDYTDNELKGVDVATPQAAGKTYYVMSKLAGKDFGFYVLQAGTNLGANKAYLEVTGGSPAREFIGFGEEETSLTPCPSPKGEGSEYWYDLQGRKVNGKPTKKGVYVVNGQKVVIK